MYMIRFQQGDKVSYCGEKLRQLAGQLGIVHARVGNTESEVVVDFGRDSYILDEASDLTKFQGKEPTAHVEGELGKGEKPGKADKKVAGPEVQRRKGVGGGKRSNPNQG